MAKLCENCGNKNNAFAGDPVYLEDDKILCSKCAEPIRNDLNSLFYIKTKEEFDTLAYKIISKCKSCFDASVTEQICKVINKRCNSLGFYIDEKTLTTHVKKIDTVISSQQKISSNSTGMFSNIGGKIKGLAKVFTWIGIIASVISGIAMMLMDDDIFLFIGLIIMIAGSLLSWISSFMLYGFGHLVENSDKLVSLSNK